jgi:hypothetical protein
MFIRNLLTIIIFTWNPIPQRLEQGVHGPHSETLQSVTENEKKKKKFIYAHTNNLTLNKIEIVVLFKVM